MQSVFEKKCHCLSFRFSSPPCHLTPSFAQCLSVAPATVTPPGSVVDCLSAKYCHKAINRFGEGGRQETTTQLTIIHNHTLSEKVIKNLPRIIWHCSDPQSTAICCLCCPTSFQDFGHPACSPLKQRFYGISRKTLPVSFRTSKIPVFIRSGLLKSRPPLLCRQLWFSPFLYLNLWIAETKYDSTNRVLKPLVNLRGRWEGLLDSSCEDHTEITWKISF